MKNSFLIYILACVTSLFIFTSCEENGDQTIKAQPDSTKEITTRTIEDCEDCPDVHCCCAVEYLDDGPASLLFCGVYTAMIGPTCGPFSPPSPCGTVSGTSSTLSLGGMNPTRGLFCVGTGGSFRLQNIGDPVYIRITCQYNDITPDWEYIELGVSDVLYFDSDGGCFLVECN